MTEFNPIENLKVEGFNPNDFAKPYEENPDEAYLPYEIQRWWFNTICPNGRISVTRPEPDAERTPGAYVATATIWKDKSQEVEDIVISSRAVPSESNTIDPYTDCQRKAISLALKTLGFWLTPSTMVSKPMVNPDDKGLVHGAAEEKPEVKETPALAPVTDASVESVEATPKKRGRKPRATVDEATAPVEEPKVETPAPVEEAPVKEATAVEPTVSEPVTTEPAPVEEPKEEAEPLMPLDEARATVISYRNHSGQTIGELADSPNPKDRELLNWFANSTRAAGRYEKEVAAAKAVLASEGKA